MIFIVYFIIGVVFGYIGAKMAGARGRDPALWGLLCFLFPLLGVLVLALAGNRNNPIVVSPAAPAVSGPATSYNAQKWEVLVGVDNDIADAVKSLGMYGQRYIDELAEKYLALNDKSYLPQLVANIQKSALAEVENKNNQQAAMQAHLLSLEEEQRAAISAIVEDFNRQVERNRGRDPETGQPVTAVAPYGGRDGLFRGGIMVTLADGRAVLRQKGMVKVFPSVQAAENGAI